MWGRRKSRLVPHLPRSLGRRLTLGLVVALAAAAFYYFGTRREFRQPPVEEAPPVRMSVEQEAALGLQAAPLLIRQHGGLDSDPEGQALVERIGARLVEGSAAGKTPYRFTFHLLADPRVVDVFALPGGPVLMTAGLAARLRTEGEFAAVLAHAVAHVVERHAARWVAGVQPAEDPPSAAALAAFNPDDSTRAGYPQIAALIAQAVAVTYAPIDEQQADTLGVRFMAEAGYDPHALIGVMETLGRAAAGGNNPAFFNTHPNPERRLEHIQRAIEKVFPNGVPEGLME